MYLAKILYEQTDEDHFLTTAQLIQILEEQYGIKSHRQTIKAEIELLRQFGLEIEEVKSITGLGLMLGIELKTKNAGEIAKKCSENGLLILTAKTKLRMLPPLVITKDEIDKGVNILKNIIAEV